VPEKYVGMTGACKLCGGRITIRPDTAVVAPDKSGARAPSPSSTPPWDPPPFEETHAPDPVMAADVYPGFMDSDPVVPLASAPGEAPAPEPAPPPQPVSAPVGNEAASTAEQPETLEPWSFAQEPPVVEETPPPDPGPPTPEAVREWLRALPRTMPSLREVDEKLPRPLFLSDDDLARSKAYFDVPFLVARKGEALAIVKTTRDNVGAGTSLAVAAGDVAFAASYHDMPEYPILQLLFTIQDNPARPLRFESLPLLTDGNVIEFLLSVLDERRLSFALYAGHQSHHVATGDVRLDDVAAASLEEALAAVLVRWRRQAPKPADHDLAVRRFARDALHHSA